MWMTQTLAKTQGQVQKGLHITGLARLVKVSGNLLWPLHIFNQLIQNYHFITESTWPYPDPATTLMTTTEATTTPTRKCKWYDSCSRSFLPKSPFSTIFCSCCFHLQHRWSLGSTSWSRYWPHWPCPWLYWSASVERSHRSERSAATASLTWRSFKNKNKNKKGSTDPREVLLQLRWREEGGRETGLWRV